MKQFIATLAAVAAFAVAGSAAAASPVAGYYVQGSGGQNYQSDRDSGTALSASFGKDFGKVRVEGEYLATRGTNSATLGDTAANLVNANVFYQPITFANITPFIGAGVGYGELFRSGVVGDQNGVVFNGTVGVSYPISGKLSAVLQYREFLANSIQFRKAPGNTDNYKASVATMGLRYTF
jgi:opacity protein-like surface antigen